MTDLLFVVIIGVLVLLFVIAAAVMFDLNLPGLTLLFGGERTNIRSLMNTQREATTAGQRAEAGKSSVKKLFQVASENKVQKKADTGSKLTLQKKLKYAKWKMPAVVYRLCCVGISIFVFVLVSQLFNILIQLMSLLVGPLVMSYILNRGVDKRFKNFDADYPAFLLSLVGLLKTGMNPMQAIEAASHGLNDGSLVKLECEMMIERLRFGVSEDKSIGAFAEDVYHPEIELYVQALLLSRRVGGTLSDTLDRLAKQVRKRQYFRMSANAAVGMQRGSIYFIIAILLGLEGFMAIFYPQAVFGSWNEPTGVGKQVWQTCAVVISLGIYWVNQVTKIKT